jgi:hypothetical protein
MASLSVEGLEPITEINARSAEALIGDSLDIVFHNAAFRIMPTRVRRVDARSGESRVDFAS